MQDKLFKLSKLVALALIFLVFSVVLCGCNTTTTLSKTEEEKVETNDPLGVGEDGRVVAYYIFRRISSLGGAVVITPDEITFNEDGTINVSSNLALNKSFTYYYNEGIIYYTTVQTTGETQLALAYILEGVIYEDTLIGDTIPEDVIYVIY